MILEVIIGLLFPNGTFKWPSELSSAIKITFHGISWNVKHFPYLSTSQNKKEGQNTLKES